MSQVLQTLIFLMYKLNLCKTILLIIMPATRTFGISKYLHNALHNLNNADLAQKLYAMIIPTSEIMITITTFSFTFVCILCLS